MSKGKRREKHVDESIQAAGFWTYRPENASYGDNDMWNWFDIAAIREGELVFVQVKSNSTQGELGPYIEGTQQFQRLEDVTVLFVIIYDGQGGHDPEPAAMRCGVCEDGDIEWAVDERELDCGRGEGLTEWLG